jgi:hypothetical protein
MSIIIKRPRLDSFLGRGGKRLLYGRRKTGKTFYTRHRLRDYEYYIVRHGGIVYDPLEDYEFDLRGLLRECRSNKSLIIDEFHRLDPRFMDAVHGGECTGNIVLITSTLHYYRRFVEGPQAPLKGLFATMRVGLLSPLELLSTKKLVEGKDPKTLLERLVFYQEPSVIGWGVEDIIESGWDFSKTLVGEVLDEEDAAYTRRIDALMEAIALGKNRVSEMTSHMYSRRLIGKESTGLVTKYLSQAQWFGLIEKIPVWGRRKGSFYRHVSSLTWLAYYLQGRYGYYDMRGNIGFGVKVAKNLIPFLVEQFVERFLADLYGLKPVKVMEPEIDIALAEYKKLKIVAEVKWKKSIDREDVRKAEEKLYKVRAEKRFLILPDKDKAPKTSLETLDTEDLIKNARKFYPQKNKNIT